MGLLQEGDQASVATPDPANSGAWHFHVDAPAGFYESSDVPQTTPGGEEIKWDLITPVYGSGGTQADLTGHVPKGGETGSGENG